MQPTKMNNILTKQNIKHKPVRLTGPLIAADLLVISAVGAIQRDSLDWQPDCLVSAGIGHRHQIVLCIDDNNTIN